MYVCSMYVCMYVCMYYLHTCVCVCVCVCMCVCVYVCVCLCVCVYIHTHIGYSDQTQVAREANEGGKSEHSFKNVLFACKIYNKSRLLDMKHLGGKSEKSLA